MLTDKVKAMTTARMITRIALAATLIGSLGGCTIVPAQPGYYRSGPAYVETYPTYRHGYSDRYYGDHRHYDNRSYREQRSYQEPRRIQSPLESAARAHRDVRRSLGLPRLPGMP